MPRAAKPLDPDKVYTIFVRSTSGDVGEPVFVQLDHNQDLEAADSFGLFLTVAGRSLVSGSKAFSQAAAEAYERTADACGFDGERPDSRFWGRRIRAMSGRPERWSERHGVKVRQLSPVADGGAQIRFGVVDVARGARACFSCRVRYGGEHSALVEWDYGGRPTWHETTSLRSTAPCGVPLNPTTLQVLHAIVGARVAPPPAYPGASVHAAYAEAAMQWASSVLHSATEEEIATAGHPAARLVLVPPAEKEGECLPRSPAAWPRLRARLRGPSGEAVGEGDRLGTCAGDGFRRKVCSSCGALISWSASTASLSVRCPACGSVNSCAFPFPAAAAMPGWYRPPATRTAVPCMATRVVRRQRSTALGGQFRYLVEWDIRDPLDHYRQTSEAADRKRHRPTTTWEPEPHLAVDPQLVARFAAAEAAERRRLNNRSAQPLRAPSMPLQALEEIKPPAAETAPPPRTFLRRTPRPKWRRGEMVEVQWRGKGYKGSWALAQVVETLPRRQVRVRFEDFVGARTLPFPPPGGEGRVLTPRRWVPGGLQTTKENPSWR